MNLGIRPVLFDGRRNHLFRHGYCSRLHETARQPPVAAGNVKDSQTVNRTEDLEESVPLQYRIRRFPYAPPAVYVAAVVIIGHVCPPDFRHAMKDRQRITPSPVTICALTNGC
jgi:hypothetical protein